MIRSGGLLGWRDRQVDSRNVSELYDACYFATGCGRPYHRDEEWLQFFGSIADRIMGDIHPSTVLDAGCAMGFLVEALRQRGVEAFGVDVSRYAIQNAHPDIQPYCWVGSVTDPFPRKYDLIVCIEVFEHLLPREAEQAVENLCRHSDDVLFSSTPLDYKEATHFNVQPPEYWAELFAHHGFFRDVDFDASFITPWAVRFRKVQEPVARLVAAYERRFWRLLQENQARRELSIEQRNELAEKEQALQTLRVRVAETEQELWALNAQMTEKEQVLQGLSAQLAEKEQAVQALIAQVREWETRWNALQTSKGWALLQVLWRIRSWLILPGSLRERILQPKIQSLTKNSRSTSVTEPTEPDQSQTWTAQSKPGAGGRAEQCRSAQSPVPRLSVSVSQSAPGVIAAYTAYPWENVLPILRILGPAEQAGLHVIRGNECGSQEVSLEAVSIADIVVIQRDFPRYTEAYEQIVARAHAEGKPVIYDIDDLLLDLPENHPDKQIPPYYRAALIPMLRAIVEADAVTVSTPPLCEYLRSFNSNTWLLPNYLNDQLWAFRNRPKESGTLPVIVGYMGTGSHLPDLEYITPPLLQILEWYGKDVLFRFWVEKLPANLKNKPNVEWISLRLDNYAEFALYFLKQECDIFISPLCDNLFNQCKSPIKFLEYSTLGVPGVYSHIAPYENVVIHGENGFLASNMHEWEEYLSQLIETPSLRHQMGLKAQQTVRQQLLLSQHAHEWLDVYQRVIGLADQPRQANDVAVRVIQQVQRWQQELEADLVAKKEQVGQRAEPDQVVATLQAEMAEKEQAVQALSAQLAIITSSRSWALLRVLWRIRLWFAPSGSQREHIWRLGMQALRVWKREGFAVLMRKIGCEIRRLVTRNLPFISMTGPTPLDWYQSWIAENEPDEAQLAEQRQTAKSLAYRPLISIITPVYNPAPEILHKTIQSVVDQTYDHWELCLVDGHSKRAGVEEVLKEWADRDGRIHVKLLDRNLGVSGNSNEALTVATGEFVALLDHDDLLAPFALFEVAKFLNEHPHCDMVYSDEDKIEIDGRRHTPFFKPEWSPDLLQCFMYTGHLTVYRRDLVQSLGGFRSEFDFSQDYDLALQVTEKTDRIGHIPKVLYHWQVLQGSAAAGDKPFARAGNIAALASAVERRGYNAEVLEYPTANRVKFNLQDYPLVSIIIPTDREQNILRGLESLLRKTKYPYFEIVVVTNTGLATQIGEVYANNSRIRTVPFDAPFNFSAKCNRGAREAKGEYILFLNDDVEPLDEAWIECMLGYFQQDDVGAVSPKLIYSNGLVQHAGLVTGVRGFVGTAFHVEPGDSTTYFNLLQSTRTVSALSAACLLMRKRTFDLTGGFDEANIPIMHSDVDLCFKIRERGLRLVYTPFTSLKHIGHASLAEIEGLGRPHSHKADLYLLKRWGGYLSYDPYYTDNMRDLLYRDSPTKYRMYASNQPDSMPSEGDILFVSHDLSLSGAPIIMHTLAKYILHAGYFVTLVAPVAGKLIDQYRQENIPVIIDPLVRDSPATLENLIHNYDVVVANTILSWGLVNSAKSLGKPVIWLVHEGDFGCALAESNADVRKALAVADVVVFPSRQTEEKYRKFAIRENYMVLHYGIEVTEPRSGKVYPPQSDKLRVVQVGSIEPRKGQDVLVRCVNSLPLDLRDAFVFHFVGRVLDNDYYDKLRRNTAGLRNVHWVGEVSHDEALQHISDSDALVCASRDDPSPLCVLEAMAFGKGIVSTDVGAMPDIIEHEVSGIIIDVEDRHALAKSLVRLHQDRDLLRRMGDAARRKFKEYLTVERYADDLIKVIKRVTSAGAPLPQ